MTADPIHVLLQGGDRLLIMTPGGGGFGDPAEASDEEMEDAEQGEGAEDQAADAGNGAAAAGGDEKSAGGGRGRKAGGRGRGRGRSAAGRGGKQKGGAATAGGGGKAAKEAAETKKRKLPQREGRPQRPLRDGGSLGSYKANQESA